MDKIGTITFQSNESSDVFYVADVYEAGIEESDENVIGVIPAQFEGVACRLSESLRAEFPNLCEINLQKMAAKLCKACCYRQTEPKMATLDTHITCAR